MSFKSVSLMHLSAEQLKKDPPNLVILPWGATEAHNRHLPYASDVIEATVIANEAASRAGKKGARVVVLPTIPFGNNAQHLDQSVTIHLNTTTALAILRDVVASLTRQGIDRLLLFNAHGGNNFKPLVRDLQNEFPILIVVADLLDLLPEEVERLFDEPGDHAGALETSLMMHISPDDVDMSVAGSGSRNPARIAGLSQKGIWTPRPWSQTHPDAGSGNPAGADAAKGKEYFNLLCDGLSEVICNLSAARKGDLPYI